MADIDVVERPYCVPRSWLTDRNSLLNFYLGETRVIVAQIIAGDSNPFTIGSATWSLNTVETDEVVIDNEPVPQISNVEKTIAIRLTPPSKGIFNLVLKYTIANNVLIEKARVVVT